MLNLDTHILIHALGDTLTPLERRILANDTWSVCAIVLWEIAKLSQRGRIEMDLESSEFTRLFARVHVWPLSAAVCRQSTHLDFESDPADELIAATSIVHGIPLVTRDSRIRKSKMVPFAKNLHK